MQYLRLGMARKLTIFSLALALIPLAVVGSYLKNSQTKAAIVSDCLPKHEKRKVSSHKGYELWIVGHGKHARDYLIRYQDQVCILVNRLPGQPGEDRPLADFIDRDIAIELNKQRFEGVISQMGGLKIFQQMLDAEAVNSKAFMPSDIYEALVSIGVETPENIEISDTPPDWSKLDKRKAANHDSE